jgi:DNA-binding SARP family transcriptional activator/tetratricopeptide (TPR) repeat protein
MSTADESDETGRLVVGLLGPVNVHVADRSAGISQPGLKVLLAMLALSANHVVPVSTLIYALWQEDASRQREKNLHVQVHLLRRRLAELEPGRGTSRIVTAPPGYLLSIGDGELDVESFAALSRRGRLLAGAGDPAAASDVFGQALGLWRGPALGDVAYTSPRLEAEAAGLEEQRLAVLEDKADADLTAGRHSYLAGYLPAMIAQFPLRERLRGQLMLALYRCGRQGDALSGYRDARQVLAEELGLDPGPQLQALHQQILTADPRLAFSPPRAAQPGEPALVIPAGAAGTRGSTARSQPVASAQRQGQRNEPAGPPMPREAGLPAIVVPRQLAGGTRQQPVVPRQLPAGTRHFAGRQAELAELDDVLREAGAATAVIVITGTGGVGKTALALHWAHSVARRFPDGQLHVNLRGYDPAGFPATSADCLRGLLDGLGVPREQIPDSVEARAGLYRSVLAGRRVLVLLDNAADAEQVRPLLPGSSGCLVLVTSRSALPGLVATESAHPVSLGLLGDDAANAMLAARLGPGRTAAEPTAASLLVRLCGGLPLALAITAARAAAQPALPLSALADELTDEQHRLDALDTGDPMTSLRAAFSWSCRQLSDPAARMFRLLGGHPGPDISAAAAASMAGQPAPQARRALGELVSASLLTEHAPRRYMLHDLLRAYAAEQRPEADTRSERRSAQARLVDHYLHTAYAGALLLAPVGHPIILDPALPGALPERLADRNHALAWFRTELPVLLAVVDLAAASGLDEQAWQLPWTLRGVLDGQGLWQDWDAVNRIALAAAERLQDHNGMGWTHHRMAQVCSLSGAINEGITHNMQALTHFALAGNVAGQGSARLGLCIARGRQGHHEAALEHGEQALGLFRAAGDRIGEAFMLHLVGLELGQLGNPELGREHCMQAVELYGELDDPGGLADAWHSLGTLHKQLGEHPDAIACFQQSLMLSATLGDRWGQAYCLIYVGDTHDAAGDLLAAREAWQHAIDMLGDLRHPDTDRIRARLRETAGQRSHATGADTPGETAPAR